MLFVGLNVVAIFLALRGVRSWVGITALISSRDVVNCNAVSFAMSCTDHGRFSPHNVWKAGSARNGSQSGSSLRRAVVIGAGL